MFFSYFDTKLEQNMRLKLQNVGVFILIADSSAANERDDSNLYKTIIALFYIVLRL